MCVAASAQIASDYWHVGEIITASNDTVKGLLKYNFDEEILQLLDDGHIKTYTPVNTKKVVFRDTTTGETRYLLVCPRTLENGIEVKNFFEFEMLFKGHWLLSREQIVYRANSSVGSMGFSADTRELDHAYFLYKEGVLTFLPLTKKKVLAFFATHEAEMEVYIKENKLKVSRHEDFLLIFTHYNKISNVKETSHTSN